MQHERKTQDVLTFKPLWYLQYQGKVSFETSHWRFNTSFPLQHIVAEHSQHMNWITKLCPSHTPRQSLQNGENLHQMADILDHEQGSYALLHIRYNQAKCDFCHVLIIST